jgi:multiple sugar transport system permease protein
MRKRRIVKRLRTIGLHAVIALIALAFAFPLLWMFMTSFKSPREYYRMPPKFLPDKFHIFHYKEAFAPWTINPTELSESTYWIEESAGRVEPVTPNIFNSILVIAGSVFLSMAVGIWAAYALSRFSFRGSEQMGIWILSTRMMPPIVIAVPLFWVMKGIRLVGSWTHLGLRYDPTSVCHLDDEGLL